MPWPEALTAYFKLPEKQSDSVTFFGDERKMINDQGNRAGNIFELAREFRDRKRIKVYIQHILRLYEMPPEQHHSALCLDPTESTKLTA